MPAANLKKKLGHGQEKLCNAKKNLVYQTKAPD